MSKETIERHKVLKQRSIEYKGGKCILCNYSKCSQAMVFHHVDPDQKEFGIARDTSRSWIKIQKELDKCVLLCHNCHSEVHAGLVKL